MEMTSTSSISSTPYHNASENGASSPMGWSKTQSATADPKASGRTLDHTTVAPSVGATGGSTHDYVAFSHQATTTTAEAAAAGQEPIANSLPPPPPPPLPSSLWGFLGQNQQYRENVITTAASIALGAICGAWTRMILAQLFGEACAHPGTVGWLSAGAPLCVTASSAPYDAYDNNGDSVNVVTQQGGMVFSDLPSNMVGSFLMGLFQDGTVLGLAIPVAIAWLPASHAFQKATIWHVAFKTGFCGSLTTLSSWNSAMVVLLFGTASETRQSQIWKAVFGYIIGMETSLGSFVLGCAVARLLHRWVCPDLAREADVCLVRREQGVYINRTLPDLERRYLHRLDDETELTSQSQFQSPQLQRDPTTRLDVYTSMPLRRNVEVLRKWRDDTTEARRVGSPLLSTLIDIEKAVLQEPNRANSTIPPEAESIARSEGWDVDGLLRYVKGRDDDADAHSLPMPLTKGSNGHGSNGSSNNNTPPPSPFWIQLPFVTSLLVIVLSLLATGMVIVHDSSSATSVTNRTMMFAMLIAPTGAWVRWILSSLNGACAILSTEWKWLPAGTLVANIIGSVVSIVSVSVEYRLTMSGSADTVVDAFWAVGTLRAVKIGFAGCLTTVSTFVAEINGFMRDNKSTLAYTYMFITLGVCCSVASLLYGCIVYL